MSKGKASKFARTAAKSTPRDAGGDEFDFGKFVVTYVGCAESENGAFCVTFRGAGKDEKIGERIQWFSTAGKAVHVSGPRLKRMAMLLAGIEDSNEYNRFDPEGVFLDALLNSDLDAAAAHLAEEKDMKAKAALAQLTETEFVVRVSQGGEKDDGGFFKNCDFRALDGDAEAEDEDDAEPESEAKPRAGKKASKRAPVEVEDDEDEDEDDAEDEDEAPESEEEPPRRSKKKARRSGK